MARVALYLNDDNAAVSSTDFPQDFPPSHSRMKKKKKKKKTVEVDVEGKERKEKRFRETTRVNSQGEDEAIEMDFEVRATFRADRPFSGSPGKMKI
ncbi:hypothetical protein RUM44_007925 [Polyplax serrata]|uniref:Uncharacterized protein n=1 Tax=Polyplax serrata TaxID=468196 RepID=A0ABR1B7F7_POLSC